jgi:hypothetical protein
MGMTLQNVTVTSTWAKAIVAGTSLSLVADATAIPAVVATHCIGLAV